MKRSRVLMLLASGALAGCAAPHNPKTGLADTGPKPASARLIGATPETLKADLGEPSLLRVDGPAEVWLYHSPICRLDVILYRGAKGAPVVRLARAAPRGVADATCVASLEQQRAS
ncbi:hypothetical protein FE249_04835 [Acidiphilium multivorum]|uniref:hypothetical protein n=1 Tax=Acidiphilium multivorum TaxID=62140 RepID=UPI001F4BFCD4|nr:hypothetical protein [Acidiphilium multivorum]UNC13607.1 hypothetical protein FE249_04835 [Acidiphilium multivorum]